MERAFALLIPRLSGFFSLPISLSRRIRDYHAIMKRVDTKVGGLSASLRLMQQEEDVVDFRARPVFVSKLERTAAKILRAVVLRDYTSRLACVGAVMHPIL